MMNSIQQGVPLDVSHLPIDVSHLPKVLFVGGPDVDARLELMHCLRNEFDLGGLGSTSKLQGKFQTEGFGYTAYHLNRTANPILDIQTFVQLAFIFKKLKPQIVHTFDTKPGVLARLAARLVGVPIIMGTLPGLGTLYVGNNFKTKLLRLIYQPLQWLASRSSALTIFQNQEDAAQFIKAGIVPRQKTKIIFGSGVATNIFAPGQVSEKERLQLRQEFGIKSNEVVVTMISRLIRSKGVLDFVAAAQQVQEHHAGVRFLLVGPEDTDSIDRLTSAEINLLKQVVIWPGPRRDIPTILAATDIFVLPSAYREGIPRVLLEAASMRLPIITTNSPGCNEVVEDSVNGFLVPSYNPVALCAALSRLIKDPKMRQRFGEISRQRAVERFDLSVVAEQTRFVYQQLLVNETPQRDAEV